MAVRVAIIIVTATNVATCIGAVILAKTSAEAAIALIMGAITTVAAGAKSMPVMMMIVAGIGAETTVVGGPIAAATEATATAAKVSG